MKLLNTLTKSLMALALTASAALAADPFLGTWKLDTQKTKTRMNPQVLDNIVLTLESAGKDTYRVITRANAAAAPTPDQVKTWVADGKTYREKHHGQDINVKVERLGESHLKTATWQDSSDPLVWDWVISGDGKTLTSTRVGGETEVLVFTRQ